MSTYMQIGNRINVSPDGAVQVYHELPAGVYNIVVEPMQAPCLVRRENLPMPTKVYGELDTISDHILASFYRREANTGVLLSGMKGSGKTLIARNISNKLLEKGIPTIVIPPNQINPGIISFLQLVSAPCMLLFDEIDKISGDEDDIREATDCMLGFLDGISIGKKLSVLTVNESEKVNSNFLDRPGRLFYHYKFEGITPETAKQFCLDRLEDKAVWSAFERIVQFSKNLSFDMLQALVEECNAFKCTPAEALKVLNVNPTISGYFKFTVSSDRNYRVYWDEHETQNICFEHNPDWINPEYWVELPESEMTEEFKTNYRTSSCPMLGGVKHPAAKGHVWVEFDNHFNSADYEKLENGSVTYKRPYGITITFMPYTLSYHKFDW